MTVACDRQSTAPAPTAPTPPAAPTPAVPITVTSITITVTAELRLGSPPAQATARADFSDGTSSDVTQLGEWQSANAGVAAVTNGMVEPRAVGEVQISLTYKGSTANATVRVLPRVVDATGTVVNTFDGSPVANAVILIETGADAGRTARSEANGLFVFPGLASLDVVVVANADGYEAERDKLSAHSPIVLRMEPLLTTSRWSGVFKSLDQWIGWPGDFTFDTQHAGPTTLTFEAGCVTFGTYGEADLDIRRLPDLVNVLHVDSFFTPSPPGVFLYTRSAILPRGSYRLSAGSVGVGWDGCPWTVTLSRPY